MYDSLDNHEQLLLYIAGELPEANRARLEERLAQDTALRTELDSLRVTQQSVDRSMATILAASEPIPESHLAAATRQTSRLMRQWQVDRATRSTKIAEPRRWQWNRSTYSIAAAVAAIVLIGLGVWWGNSDSFPPNSSDGSPPELVGVDNADPVDAFAVALERSMLPSADDGIDQSERKMDDLRSLSNVTRSGSPDLETQ